MKRTFARRSRAYSSRRAHPLLVTLTVLALAPETIFAMNPPTIAPAKHTNRLIDATSPYLLQHAHNPVDWYPWGPEALQKARAENKPIFLSIGYAACHWCHVMEHECFENEAIAALMNQHFVNIKVDREERPDIDEIYMHVTQEMTGHGGWPMSVFLTPNMVPFYAGTYFPPPQFTQLLQGLANSWKENGQRITTESEQNRLAIQAWAQGPPPAPDLIDRETVFSTARMLASRVDRQRGGMLGSQNKFPPSMTMELLLRTWHHSGDADLLQLVQVTLDHMARGGIYDHLGGGICRYSTDPDWLVPHFEKMLYDQALVSAIYLDAYQATQSDLYANTARGIFDYVLADLQSPEGGLYSTRDADSGGLEGAYYIWTVEEITEILGQENAELFCEFYDVTERGNWFESRGHAPEGPKNILNIKVPLEDFAKAKSMQPADFAARLQQMHDKLLPVRAQRVEPGLDDKVLSGWNGLMIASLAKGARVLDEPKYAQAAARAADFVLDKLLVDGRLLRSYRKGKAHIPAYLEDYAFMIEGLLNLYEADFNLKWLQKAETLNETLIKHYFDEQGGGFYFTADDAEELLARTKNSNDGAIPSGNSIEAANLLRLAILLNRPDLRDKAESIFRAFKPQVDRAPWASEKLLCAVDFYHGKPKEIALVGPLNEAATQALLAEIHRPYVPNKLLAHSTGPADPAANKIPLLKQKDRVNGKAAAYVCQDYRCKLPVTDPQALASQLNAGP